MSQLSPVLQRAPLGGDLIDLVTESVAQPPCPADRAQIILDLLDVALDAVSWRLTGDGSGEEEQSIRAIIAAARQHQTRMRYRLDHS